MSIPYIPRRQDELDPWALNFSTLLSANPATYGVTVSDAQAMAAVYATWRAAYIASSTPATRTTPAIAAKNAARAAMIATIRPLAQMIARNNGVTDGNKLTLGLNLPAARGPGMNPAPQTSPILAVIGATPGQLTIRFHDQNSQTSRGKPPGAIALELRAGTFEEAVNDPATIPFAALVTRQPYGLDFKPADRMKIAYLAARWVNATGKSGPWSSVVSFGVV